MDSSVGGAAEKSRYSIRPAVGISGGGDALGVGAGDADPEGSGEVEGVGEVAPGDVAVGDAEGEGTVLPGEFTFTVHAEKQRDNPARNITFFILKNLAV